MNAAQKLDVWLPPELVQPRHRIVLLGASNLSRSFPVAVETARSMFDGPLSMVVAKGHGRSYGQDSSFFWKKNSGIFSCGLWGAVFEDISIPTVACVTDIGNDLAYEVPVETILDWVRGCLEHLQSLDARVVIAELPIEVLRGLTPAKYLLFRTFLFPGCGLSFREILGRAEQLNERLRDLAKAHQIPCFTAQERWYGFDPIHIRRAHQREVWRELFALLGGRKCSAGSGASTLLQRAYLNRLRPESWHSLGRSRRAIQPDGRLQDGTSIALY